jgi:glycerol-3-phosphate dehydrogenase
MHNLSLLDSEPFDVLVIGGGITGAGVALDAVARGFKVALVEKNDFASGTSSKSTKLVHGGIRYLPNFDFALVHEALVERGILVHTAPFLVHPVPFVLPMYKGDLHPVGMPFTTPNGIGLSFILNIGLYMYDALAGRRNVGRHRHLSRKDVMRLAPALKTEDLEEGYLYYDAQTNDARLTMAVLRTAAGFGATITNYTEVTGFLMEKDRIVGAHVLDRLGDQQLTVRARYVVNATGIYAEQIEGLTGHESQIEVQPSKGVHLVLSCKDLELGSSAIVLPETEDKRILFIVPWQSRAVYGTTDTGTGDLDHPVTKHEEIEYLLKYLNRYLSVHLTEENIISTYAGYRPLIRPRSAKNRSTARLSRTHAVLEDSSGLITIVGGKLTTYRRMAQDTLDVISKRSGVKKPLHPTENLPLAGSAGWPNVKTDLEERAGQLAILPDTLAHLERSYGSLANEVLDLVEKDASLGNLLIEDLPYIRAEVIYACCDEMAMTPFDVLARRTSIMLEDRQRGLGILDEVATMMAKEEGWTPEQQRQLVDSYRSVVERQVAAEGLHIPMQQQKQ